MNDYRRIVRRSWPLIAVMGIIGLAAAWAINSTTTPQYSATSAAFVSSDRSGTLTELTQGNAFTEKRVSTYAELAKEPRVTQPVIDDFSLPMSPAEFARQLTVTIPVDTTMIEITVKNSSPTVASSLANAVMTSLQSTVAEIETPTAAQTDANGRVIAKAAPPVKITQVRFAEVPASPVSPNLALNLAVGLLAGLALGALVAIVRDLLDPRVRGLDDVEAVTDSPVLGTIPVPPRGQPAADLIGRNAGNAFDESFRILRTNLQFLELEGPATYVVTSPGGGDGTSTVTANLGLSVASVGRRVLVVDADLRRPALHTRFGVDGGVGLADVLSGRADVLDVVQPSQSENLHVLVAGRIPPNPSELLSSPQMNALVLELQERYDVVLYAGPPVLPVPDAAIMSRYVGGVLVVAAVNHSKREQLRTALGSLARVDAKVTGIVVNRLPVRGNSAYYLPGGYESTPTEKTWGEGEVRSADGSTEISSADDAGSAGDGRADRALDTATNAR